MLLSDRLLANLVHHLLLAKIQRQLNIYTEFHTLLDDRENLTERSNQSELKQSVFDFSAHQRARGLSRDEDKKKKKEKDQREREKLQRRYELFAAQITAVGGLLNSCNGVHCILESFEDTVISLMRIARYSTKTDPKLLTAVCQFCYDVLEHPDVIRDGARLKKFLEPLGMMKQLLPYLGGEKYPELLKAASEYPQPEIHAAEEEKRSAKFEIKPSRKAAKAQMAIIENLQVQDDPIVCQLFKKIINLIRHICTEAIPKGKHEMPNRDFAEVARELNKEGREAALLMALYMRDDDIRLAVVNALYVVPLP